MPTKVPVPVAKRGDDAVAFAGRAVAAAVENGRRLDTAAENYESVRTRYGAPR